MTRQKSFTTAAARRRQDPIQWVIDGNTINLRASVDLTEISEALDMLTDDADDDGSPVFARMLEQRKKTVNVIRGFVEPASVEAFDTVEADLDVQILKEMLEDLLMEYTGLGNPSQAPASSDGLSETGNSLTAGAQQEA